MIHSFYSFVFSEIFAPSCHKEFLAYLFKLQAAYNVAVAMLC